jgi:RNA polymerase sigma factor (sigma-70 family)
MKGASATSAVREEHLREAEQGFAAMLRRKRFTQIWIAEHAEDLLGQARKEYAEWLARGRPEDNPVGWLIHCAWRRTQNLLESERRKPRPSSIEEVFHLADEGMPTPEESVLDAERAGRMREAMRHVPDKERALLALVYFEDMTIRDAGQRLGWGKSSADRHHRAALDRLGALLGDRALLGAEVGLAASIALAGKRETPQLPVDCGGAVEHLQRAAEALAHRATELWRKLLPLGEPASAAAAGNAGRIAGACGTAAAALCLAGGAVGPGVAGVAHDRAAPETVSARPSQAPTPIPAASEVPAAPASTGQARPSSSRAPSQGASSSPRADVEGASSDAVERPHAGSPQPASARQVEADFGFESGAPSGPSASAEPSEPQAPASAVSSASAEEAPTPAAAPAGSAPTSPEFGM